MSQHSRTDRPAGDYIGVAIDLDAKKMDFYRNGHNMGTAYDNFSVGDGLYPAVTLSGGNPEQP
jgi:predicted metal-dependent RNase